MATTIRETSVVSVPSNPATIKVYGTITNSGAETSAVIKPGEQDTNVSGSRGLRKILSWGFSDSVAVEAVKVVKSYDATHDGDILTLTFTAGDEINYWVEGLDNGA